MNSSPFVFYLYLYVHFKHFSFLHCMSFFPSDPGSSAETNYKLTIIDEHEGGKMYNLTFPGRHTVNQVKRDVATVTGIPVFRQEWTGWPEDTNDELSLLQISLPIVHTLTVTQVPLAAISRTVKFGTEDGQGTSGSDVGPLNISDEAQDNSLQVVRHDGPSGSSQRPIVLDDTANSDVEISDDDYQDAPEPMDDDDFLLAQPSRSGIQPLLPDDFGDEALAGIKFGEEFGNRYGHPHPQFFPGSLEDALGEACNKPTSERRMLAVYLHHDSSVLTNVFCTQVFCAEAVLGLLSQNFVTWGWDLTYSSNKQRLLDMISRHFGSVASATIRNFSIEKLPLVILVAKLKGNMEIIQVSPHFSIGKKNIGGDSCTILRSSMEMSSWMSSCQPSSLLEKLIRASCQLRRQRSRRELRGIG
jgi:hypothetical protein